MAPDLTSSHPVFVPHIKHSSEGKKNKLTYLTDGVDVDVVFGVLRVRNKWLDKKLSQHTVDCLNPLLLSSFCLDPVSRFLPCLVQCKKTTLASSLDQLVGLGYEFGARLQQPRVLDLCLVKDCGRALTLGEMKRSKSGRSWVGLLAVVYRRWQTDTVDVVRVCSGEEEVEDGLAVGLEDGLG